MVLSIEPFSRTIPSFGGLYCPPPPVKSKPQLSQSRVGGSRTRMTPACVVVCGRRRRLADRRFTAALPLDRGPLGGTTAARLGTRCQKHALVRGKPLGTARGSGTRQRVGEAQAAWGPPPLQAPVVQGGGGVRPGSVAVCSANWPLATYCLSLGPSPSIGGGAHRPLTALCPPSPSLAYLLLLPLYFPFPSLGRLCHRSPWTFPVSLLCVGSTRRRPRGRGGGVWDPKNLCTKNGPPRFSQRLNSFFPTVVTLVGGGGGAVCLRALRESRGPCVLTQGKCRGRHGRRGGWGGGAWGVPSTLREHAGGYFRACVGVRLLKGRTPPHRDGGAG